MDTLYYRKIAELVRRDETAPEMLLTAERALACGREGNDRIAGRDKRKLMSWMRQWCDAKIAHANKL